MVKAWIYQVKKHGTKWASWYVGWLEPEGKRCCESCGPGSAGKKAAQRLQRKRQAELIEGTYEGKSGKPGISSARNTSKPKRMTKAESSCLTSSASVGRFNSRVERLKELLEHLGSS